MKVIVINTGTEIMLGAVLNTHLTFIARQIFPLGLRVARQIAIPDGTPIRNALAESFAEAEIIFVTGGLGPTTDDITRETVAQFLELPMRQDEEVMEAITARFARRGLKFTERISRQAQVPEGAVVLPNEHGTAPGLYLRANIRSTKSSPHLFLLPGPPRELQAMFINFVMSILREIVPEKKDLQCKTYRMAGMGESTVENAIGQELLIIPGLEVGYCARPGEVDLRVIGGAAAMARADAIIRDKLGASIFSDRDEVLEQVLVQLLSECKETLALAESCTGGHLANRLTNVPGASAVFLASYVTYSNETKIDMLNVDPDLIQKLGAVSEEVARAMADGARARARSTYAIATTGIAGPGGGSEEKPVGTVYVALASSDEKTVSKRFNFPSERETFKGLTAQAAFEMLRRRLLEK
ncbi:MAG: nicotinamide-nucleotide amidase [Verrucomicrobiota bacterium]